MRIGYIIILFCLITNFCYADQTIIGVLKTAQETYPHELDYSDNIEEMLVKLGAKPILIDYNELAKYPGEIQNVTKAFIKDNKITHVIIPGNYYNLDSPPFAPNTNRQDVTTIISNMASQNEIHLLTICGGLQGIMHASGIEIVKVESIKGNSAQHLVSDPDPHLDNVPLHKVRVNPVSKLADTLRKSDKVDIDQNGWIYLYLPDAHSRVVNNSPENMQRLESAGYKVIGFSDDGMIEIIEDKFGNIHFQDHPEGLVIAHLLHNNTKSSSLRNASTIAMIEVFKAFINK